MNLPLPLPGRIRSTPCSLVETRSSTPSPVRSGEISTSGRLDQPLADDHGRLAEGGQAAGGQDQPAPVAGAAHHDVGVAAADEVGLRSRVADLERRRRRGRGRSGGRSERPDRRELGVEVLAGARRLAGVAVTVDRLERGLADLLGRRGRVDAVERELPGEELRRTPGSSPRAAARRRSCRSPTSRRRSRCSRGCARRRRSCRRRRSGPPRCDRSGRRGSCSRCRSSPATSRGRRRCCAGCPAPAPRCSRWR